MFETIFGWFKSLYGEALGSHLSGYGWDPTTEAFDYINRNLFNVCGIVSVIVAAVAAVVFYYVWNPTYHKRAKWFGTLGIVAVINFLVGWRVTLADLVDGNINVGEGLAVSPLDCAMFGFSCVIVAVLFFTAISYLIRWRSSGNKYIPF